RRKDLAASRWRHLDRRIAKVREAVDAGEGREARRIRRRDLAACELQRIRCQRDTWLEDNPPPWLAFWRIPKWRAQRALILAAVEHAKHAARRASQAAAPEALARVAKDRQAREAELEQLLRARQAIAMLPTEQAERDRLQREARLALREGAHHVRGQMLGREQEVATPQPRRRSRSPR
ncbi:MAG: hypothetical protein R3212_02485, partial [Xanthomonadales bacterium]|nr:hypothetical protein [Xanthomonadales bacterium]